MNTKSLVIDVAAFIVDGILDSAACDQAYAEGKAKLMAFLVQDQDIVAGELATLLTSKKYGDARSLLMGILVEGIYGMRLRERVAAGKDLPEAEETTAEKERLETVLRHYIEAHPEQFHNGRRGGIAFRYVDGDYVKMASGEDKIGEDGYPIQRFRHSDLEWAQIELNRKASAAKREAKEAAKETESAKVAGVIVSKFQPIRRARSVAPESAPLSNAAE